MEETDESKFKKTIDKVAVEMKGNAATKTFGEYFEKNYKLKCEQWVICYRSSSGVNTNMYSVCGSISPYIHSKYKFINGKKITD